MTMTDAMQTPNLEEIMVKLRAIRELASRGGTQAEAEAASGRMAALLLKYSLSMADIEAHVETTQRRVVEDTFDFRANRWRQDLLFRVADAHLCKGIRFSGYQPRSHWCRMMVIGHDHNLIVVRETWEWLQVEIVRLCNAAFKSAIVDGDIGATLRPEGWKRAFHYGAVSGITDSYSRMRQTVQAEESAERWALVPVIEHEVATRLDQLFPKKGNMGRPGAVQSSAFALGRKAGAGVNLGRQVGKGGADKAIAA